MHKLLHIIASPRAEQSRTLKISSSFLEEYTRVNPECEIDELNLFNPPLPPLSAARIKGKYELMSGQQISGDIKNEWKPIEEHIERFLAANIYLISTPMWNLGIPYPLKQYIDLIVQPGYLFQYTGKGLEGLAKNRRMIVITSRGGDYSQGSPAHTSDQQEPYLRAIFGFVGITNIRFLYAQPMDSGPPEQREKILANAIKVAQEAAAS